MVQSVLARASRADIQTEPFPHLVLEEALEPEYFRELAECFPDLEKVRNGRPLENNKAYLLNAVEVLPDPEIPQIWRDFFQYHSSQGFFWEMWNFWKDSLAEVYPDIERRFGCRVEELTTALRPKAGSKTAGNDAADVMMDVQFGMNSPVTSVSRVRGPHLDKPFKLFAGLIYFRRPDDDSTGGDLGFYRYKGPRHFFDNRYDIADRFVERYREVPYRANTLVMWLNTPTSLHGVSPRSLSPVPRRYVNFIAECYRLSTEGFFSVPRSPADRTLRAVRRLVGFRDA